MKKEKKIIVNNRIYGIDLLRIVSMFFIVILHSLGHGGVLSSTVGNSSQYKLSWLLEIISFCAVNVFVLISGYVSYTQTEKKTNYSNYLNLWLQVVFYGVIIVGIFYIVNPSIVGKKDLLVAFLPVTKDAYWYFTAYTGLFMITPILNQGIRNCDNDIAKKLFIIIFIVFSFLEVLSPKFVLNSGYSFVWLALVYILGAIMKKVEIGKNYKNYQIILGIIVLYSLTYINKIYGLDISVFGIGINRSTYLSYISPTVLGISILYVIYFSRMKLNNKFNKIITFAASSTFAIYLINDNYLVRKNLIKNLFAGIANESLLRIFVIIIGFSFLFVIGAILIDKIRIFLFKIFKVKQISDRFITLLDKGMNKLTNLL